METRIAECHLDGRKAAQRDPAFIVGVTRRILTVQLKELEEHGMVKKKIYP
jgi:DNA-binding HxlR family transcriptional regulator